jgi:hypothetical protein
MTRPEAVELLAGMEAAQRLRAEGMALPDHPTPKELIKLGRAFLGPDTPTPEDYIDPPEDDPDRVALRQSRDKPGRVPWWVEVARHHGHKHAFNSPCSMPNRVEGWPHPQDHRQSHADHRTPTPEPLVPNTPEIQRPEQAAGLDQGQTGPPRRVRKRGKGQGRFRSVSYVDPTGEDDEWTPM